MARSSRRRSTVKIIDVPLIQVPEPEKEEEIIAIDYNPSTFY